MQDVYDQSLARASFTLVMLAIAAAMALTLGVIGIYGVIAYAVSQKRREIGIRLALGAQPIELRRMFVRQGLALTGIGAADRTGRGYRSDAADEIAVVRNQSARSGDLRWSAVRAGCGGDAG